MAKADAVAQVGRLVTAFGKSDISDSQVEVYVDKLRDLTPELLSATVERIIETSKFFPSIAEIRRTAAGIAGILPPSPAEALAIVRAADRCEVRGNERGGRGYVEKFWDWPSHLSQKSLLVIQDVLARVGEPSDMDGKPHFGWETGFQKTYEPIAESATADAVADLSHQLPAGQQHKMIEGW